MFLRVIIFLILPLTACNEQSGQGGTPQDSSDKYLSTFVDVFMDYCFGYDGSEDVFDKPEQPQWRPDEDYPDVLVADINGLNIGVSTYDKRTCVVDAKAMKSGNVLFTEKELVNKLVEKSGLQLTDTGVTTLMNIEDEENQAKSYTLSSDSASNKTITVTYPSNRLDDFYVSIDFSIH
ncbi:hypothetical protein DZA50_04885 [Kangiella sp. HD9-110m-PIT-SAG07]|nr:hypothetical protein DZA50_04885 [Kangiella sp. HD9-110m-PIT-SAG07]